MNNKFSDQEIVRREKLQKLIDKNENPFLIDHFNRNFDSLSLKRKYDGYTKEKLNLIEKKIKIHIAGRIKNIRLMGKACFLKIQDYEGEIQLYGQKSVLDSKWDDFQDLDIGDIIGVTGELMITNTGELTVRINNYILMSKALRPLPEKYHGLKNIEDRYRRRYVDLIMNNKSKNIFIKRSRIIRNIQNYLDELGYIEVETPILQSIHGGAEARPFTTHHNALNSQLYLRIATELHLKRLVVGGFEKVYEIGRLFRNEGIDVKHNPEFTTIEVYVAYQNLEFVMELCENIIRAAAKNVLNDNLIVEINDYKIDLSKKFKKIHMVDAINDAIGVNFFDNISYEDAKKIALKNDIIIEEHHYKVGHIINLLFEKLIEPTIIEPTFIFGHPVEVSFLAKRNKKDPRFTDRFELFILKHEYANAFSELNDPIEQKKRFQSQVDESEKGNDEAHAMDHDYIEALEYGLPPTGGLGIGIDRLVMLLTEQTSIRNVILFPTLKLKK